MVVVLFVFGVLIGDMVWYVVGWCYGGMMLKMICWLLLLCDICVKKIECFFGCYGVCVFVVVCFILGLLLVLVLMVGVFGMCYCMFVGYDVFGVVLWMIVGLMVGFVFYW